MLLQEFNSRHKPSIYSVNNSGSSMNNVSCPSIPSRQLQSNIPFLQVKTHINLMIQLENGLVDRAVKNQSHLNIIKTLKDHEARKRPGMTGMGLPFISYATILIIVIIVDKFVGADLFFRTDS